MEHRYGRHGPRAWLRLRQRRYGRPSRLPVPVEPQPTIVRVFVPTNAERIIFIVIQGAQDPNEENPNQQIVEMSTGLPTPLPYDQLPSTGEMRRLSAIDEGLASMVEVRIVDDLDEIQALIQRGKFVTIRMDRISPRARHFAKEDIKQLQGNWRNEYSKLLATYQEIYQAVLPKRLRDTSDRVKYLHSVEEVRMRDCAIQDRKQYPPSGRPFHQRDIAVIRALEVLEIPFDMAIDHLSSIHDLADIYDKYYANPGEGVDWPDDQDLFR